MKENWMVLFLSIVGSKSTNKSLNLLGIKVKPTEMFKVDLNDSSIEVIEYLRKEHSWQEIADMFGYKNLSGQSLRDQVVRYKNKKAITNEPTKVPLAISLNKKSISLYHI